MVILAATLAEGTYIPHDHPRGHSCVGQTY